MKEEFENQNRFGRDNQLCIKIFEIFNLVLKR